MKKLNQKIENHLNMFRVVLLVCLDSTGVLQLLTSIWELVQKFQENVAQFESLIQQRLLIMTGLSKDKKATKLMLASLAYRIGSALYSYAEGVEDYLLQDKVQYSESVLGVMRDNNFINTCRNYLELANTNLSNISGYGIDATVITTFEQGISLYVDRSPLPAKAIEHGARLTQDIKALDKEITRILKKRLDKAIATIKQDHPDIAGDYNNSRKVFDIGGRRSVKPEDPNALAYMEVNIADTEANPIEDAEVELKNENRTYLVTTDEDGDALHEGIVSGTYVLTNKYYGKKPITEVIEFKANDEISKDYIMENDVVMPPL
jgi:hypothetical protein